MSVEDRVKVESMGNYHVQELFDAGNNPNIWGYMPMKVQSIDDMKYFVDKVLEEREQGSEFPFIIFNEHCGRDYRWHSFS